MKKPAGKARAGRARRLSMWQRGSTASCSFPGHGHRIRSRVTRATLLRGFEPHCGDRRDPHPLLGRRGRSAPRSRARARGAAYNFTELAPFLARRHRVLIPDLPGHGGTGRATSSRTGRPGRPRRARGRARGHDPGGVLGYSMGGVVALRAAAERPGQSPLSCSSPPPGSSRPPGAPALAGRDRRAAAGAPGRARARRDRAAARPPRPVFGYWGQRAAGPLSRGGARVPRRADRARGREQASRALLRDDPRSYLDRVRCPALVVWGARPARSARGRVRVARGSRAAACPSRHRAPGRRRVPQRARTSS